MGNPECTVVIPVHNNITGCKELLGDFYRVHAKEIDKFRFIVIDQTKEGIIFETDQTREGIKFSHTVHLHIRSYRALGFSKSVNIGWKLSQTPYTLLANDDVRLLSASWYEDAKAHLKDGVLGVNPFPALRTWDGGGVPKWYWDIHGMEKWGWTKDKPYESYTDEDYKRLQGMLAGGDPPGTTYFFTMFRTEAREIVGLIDESMAINASDYDHNRRIYLTCKNCNKRKYEHHPLISEHLPNTPGAEPTYCPIDGPPVKDYTELKKFEPYKILTCTHSLVHHHCGRTKEKMAKEEGLDGYKLVSQSKNLFNKKWGTTDCPNPDIYGRTGADKPNTPWCEEVAL